MVQKIIIKQRNNVIDIARGLCIVFMIATHVEAWWGKGQQFSKYTGVFFLVFFFFGKSRIFLGVFFLGDLLDLDQPGIVKTKCQFIPVDPKLHRIS